MADKKWQFRPSPPKPMPPGMNCKPWFKDRDRLPSRYFSKHNRLLKYPVSMDSRQWVFVKEGLDDFRTGCPPCDNMIVRGHREGFLPLIANRVPRPPPTRIRRKPPTGEELLSKLSPAQRARRAFVQEVEASLTKHPLASYPDLEESLPADLLLKVLKVLDPDKKLADTWAYCQRTRERKKSPSELSDKRPDEPDEVGLKPPEEIGLEPPKEDGPEPPEEVGPEPPEEVGPEPPEEVAPKPPEEVGPKPPEEVNLEPLEEDDLESPEEVGLEPPLSYISDVFNERRRRRKSSTVEDPDRETRRAIHEFFIWIDQFEDLGLDEEFFMKRFELEYQRIPTYRTRRIKKVSRIPVELVYSQHLDEIQQRRFSLREENLEKLLQKPKDPYKPKRQKIRYGAWYLPPKTWKKLVNDEPWIDPKVLREEEERRKKFFEPDILDDLYGPIAFKDFIISNGYEMPHVIEELFQRKGWSYDSVKTPMERVIKYLKQQRRDSADYE